MHLEKLFQLYLEQAKKRVLTLFDNERTKACQWIKKIELAPNPGEQEIKLQLHSLKLLLLSLESNCLIGPFEKSPLGDKEFTQYDWYSYELTDFSNMIRSKQDKRKCPEISYAVSGNRRELATYQNDQDTGQHCYYACSKQPIDKWRNLQSGVIDDESIAQWKERGELEELNRKESTCSSVDIPRCVMHTTSSGIDFNPNDERYSERFQKTPNLSKISNFITPGRSKQTNNRCHIERPETPQRFGGRGQQSIPYGIEQFGLSQNERFRSPRGVFQNLDYDRLQTHRSPMPTRLTEEVIESFDNARFCRGPLNEVKHNDDAKQELRARYQKIRDGMNKKPQVEVRQQEIEVEPEMVPYERITLQEPCEVISSRYQETEEDLGILSEAEMNDEVLFGENKTIDPRIIFKTKNENLVSRNVTTIETNTTINGSRREVTEKILEQEDVNVVERSGEDENLENVSEPNSNSPLRHSPSLLSDHMKKKPEHRKSKPRRFLADYSDLPQEDLEDISKPTFQQESFCQGQEEDMSKFYSGGQQDNSQKSILRSGRRPAKEIERLDDVCQPEFPTTIEDSRVSAQVDDASERLEDIRQPEFASTLADSIACSVREQGYINSRNQRRQQVDQSRRFIRHEPLCCGQESENLDDIEQPHYQSFNDSNMRTRTCKHSTENAFQDTASRTKCPTIQSPQPQAEISKVLNQGSYPRMLSSIENPHESLTRRNRQRVLPQVDTTERLDQISHPDFVDSLHDSTVKTRRGEAKTSFKCLRLDEASEKIDEVSQPSFLHSTEKSYQYYKCPTRQCLLPQMGTSERLDQVSYPRFMSSTENPLENLTRRNRQRPMPQVHTSERLDQISHPGLVQSLQESRVPSRRGRDITPRRCLPQFEESERLDEVSMPELLHSTGVSYQDSRTRTKCSNFQRRLPQVETSERIDQVSHPAFLSSFEDSKIKCPPSQRPFPQVHTSEELDQISSPSYSASFPDSKAILKRDRCTLSHKRFPVVDTSERLDEVSQPGFSYSADVSNQDSTRGTSCPTSQRPPPEIETSERIYQVSQPRFLEDNNKECRRKCISLSRQKPILAINTSERLDQVSHPSFMASFQESTVPSKRGFSPHRGIFQAETSEILDEVSQPEFLHSTEVSYQNSTRRTRCPTNQRPLPEMETSERIDQVSQPGLLTSVKHTYGGSRRSCKCPLSKGALPQVEISEKLDQISQPAHMSSFRDSSPQFGGRNEISTNRLPPPIETREHLSQVSHPNCWKRMSPVDDIEKLDSICQPEFPSSFEDNTQQSRREAQGMHFIPQENVSERLDSISYPFCPSSFENSIQSLEENVITPEIADEVCSRDLSSKQVRNTQGPRKLPQADESEILDAVSQPDITSFEDTGYGSQNKELEMLENVSQPIFQSSYGDLTLRSRKNSRTQEERSLPFVDNSERLDDVCELDFPSSFATSDRSSQYTCQRQRIPLRESVESKKLENVCQQSFQSSFEDSNRSPNRCLHASHPGLRFLRSKQDPRQRLMSRIGATEKLDDISQPSSFGASMYDREWRHISEQRPLLQDEESKKQSFHEESKTEHLETVTEPSFQSSFEDFRSTPFQNSQQRRPWNKIDTSEKLNDVSQPSCPACFQETLKNSQRQPNRAFPVIDVSENLEDICHPSFCSSFEESSNKSRRCENMPIQRPFQQVHEFEKLDDVSQPHFASTFYHSTDKSKASRHYPPHVNDSGRPISVRNEQSLDKRPFPQIDISERLNDISQPDFATSVESSAPRFICHSEQRHFNQAELSKHNTQQKRYPAIEVSKRLEDVSQPSFPISLEESIQYSRRNNSRPNQKSFTRESTLDRSDIDSRRFFVPQQYNTSEILEDVVQPEFPSTFQESANVSRERRRMDVDKRAMPQIDLSENIESVCQPEFPVSFEDSARNDMQNLPLTTYRKNNDCVKNYPKENLADISAPTFYSNYEDSTQRSRNNSYLPNENLEDISCPSFQTTPRLPPRCHREDCQSRVRPPRQLFPRENPRNDEVERSGDFRQVFESMPNYAPFEEQVASKRNPLASRLKLPVTFAPTKNDKFCRPELVYPGQQAQILKHEAMKMRKQNPFPTEDFCASRMGPPVMNQANPRRLEIPRDMNPMESKRPTRTVSSTKIPLPPSARTQTNVQHQEQRSKVGKSPENQERLVKKSSVKFHQTKSTYSKNKQEKSSKR